MKSKAVPGRYGPVRLDDYKGGRLAMEELHRIFAEKLTNFSIEGQATLTMKSLKTPRKRTQISV